MTDRNPKSDTHQNLPSSSSSSSTKLPTETSNSGSDFSGRKIRYPNPPETTNPDPTTLRDQWKFAIRQYSRWYSHAWGTAILAGVSFFALGWIIKGSNPLPSLHGNSPGPPSSDSPEARR